MTDKEIIQAWECHISRSLDDCKQCPYKDLKPKSCQEKLYEDIADLIKSQQAKIEILKKYNTNVARKHYFDGIKEFAERLKEVIQFSIDAWGYFELIAVIKDIDSLVKEMVGADNG